MKTTSTAAASIAGQQDLVAQVPRISIHVYCDTQQTAEMAQHAAVPIMFNKLERASPEGRQALAGRGGWPLQLY